MNFHSATKKLEKIFKKFQKIPKIFQKISKKALFLRKICKAKENKQNKQTFFLFCLRRISFKKNHFQVFLIFSLFSSSFFNFDFYFQIFFLFQQNVNDGTRVQILQIPVRLTSTHKNDWLPSDISHRNRSSNLKSVI